MKKIVPLLLISSTLLFSACSPNQNTESFDSSVKQEKVEKKEQVKLTNIIEKFKEDNLSVENERKMTKEDFEKAPMSANDAYIFDIKPNDTDETLPSRIFLFDKVADLEKTKEYYDNLGKESAENFSYTAINKKKKILMQFNGSLPQDVVEKYCQSANLKLTETNFTSNSTENSTKPSEEIVSSQETTEQSAFQGGYGDHNTGVRESRYQEALANGATEQEANDYADGRTSTYTSPPVESEPTNLTDFINKYGMSPTAYKVLHQGMSEEEALRSTPSSMKSSGEIQLG